MVESMDGPDNKSPASNPLPCNNEDRYTYLIEFAHKHLDFQTAELKSVLEMHGIAVQEGSLSDGVQNRVDGNICCHMLPLPNEARYKQEMNAAPRRAFAMLSFPLEWHQKQHELRNRDMATIFSRCVLIRRVIELWGLPGTSVDQCATNCKYWLETSKLGKSVYQTNANEDQSWKITIHTLGAKYTWEEQVDMRSKFAFLDLPGKVQMKNPTHEFLLLREMELDSLGNPLYPRHSHLGRDHVISEHDQRPPLACYFGRIIATRPNMEKYDLKRRVYLGPTSMDAELSFLMSNLGHVRKSSVVLDPFVGTGSILVSCALRGAYCVGTDIDIRVIRGRNPQENVYSNFQQFSLPKPELIRSDNAIYHRHFRRNAEPWVDTIVTDPPYGIRAGARMTGTKLEAPRPILDEHRQDHIAQTKPYNVSDVMADLLDVGARVLVMNGRLVYVIPSFATDFKPQDDLPQHECLKLEHICFQPFTHELGRRVITMKKIKEYDPSRREAYKSKTWKNGPESAEKCANIREKILEAAKQKPGYEERAKIRKQKRKEHKEAKKRAKLEQIQTGGGGQHRTKEECSYAR